MVIVFMEYYLSLALFTFVSGITPGPNTLMLMASALNHGVRRSLPHYLGICLGFPILVLITGMGMKAVFDYFPDVYMIIKVAGVSFLLYLAWKIANSANVRADEKVKRPITFMQAAAFQWLNPKAWVVAVSSLATFTEPDNFQATMFTLVFFYLVVGFITMAFWLKLGQSLRRFLNTGRRLQAFNISMALLLIVSVVPMVLSGVNPFA